MKRGRLGSDIQEEGKETEEASKHVDELEDVEVTPRPASFGGPVPQLAPRKESTKGSARSASPVKMSGLKNMQGGLGYEIISLVDVDNEDHPLQGIRSILETIDDFSLGVGVVPSSMRVRAIPSLVQTNALTYRRL